MAGTLYFGGHIGADLHYPPKGVVRSDKYGVFDFYNGRGIAGQWIREGKYALNWTRLSCHQFVANQVRLWLFILAYTWGTSYEGWYCRSR